MSFIFKLWNIIRGLLSALFICSRTMVTPTICRIKCPYSGNAGSHPSSFLFNSLNNVVSLITIDPDKAESMLISLSRLFRASFQELKLVSLHEEIELSKQYLMIEQIRLGERLKVEWKVEIEPLQLKQVTIPLLTLQPLLENSIFMG